MSATVSAIVGKTHFFYIQLNMKTNKLSVFWAQTIGSTKENIDFTERRQEVPAVLSTRAAAESTGDL